MDVAKRAALVKVLGDLQGAKALVSVEQFFDGNDDRGSFWCNLAEPSDVSAIWSFVATIAERAEVVDLRLQVYEIEEGEWPYCESVLLSTSAATGEVAEWFASYPPDEIETRAADPSLAPTVFATQSHYWLWWD